MIPLLPKDSPLVRAFRLVADHNDRHVGMIYGDSAMSHVSNVFGPASSEATAYADWISTGRALNEVYLQDLSAKLNAASWTRADEDRLQASRRAVDFHFAQANAC